MDGVLYIAVLLITIMSGAVLTVAILITLTLMVQLILSLLSSRTSYESRRTISRIDD